VDAGAAKFRCPGEKGGQGGYVKFGLRVKPSGLPGPFRVKKAVGSHALARLADRDEQVTGMGIKPVTFGDDLLEWGLRRTKSEGHGPEFLGFEKVFERVGPEDGK